MSSPTNQVQTEQIKQLSKKIDDLWFKFDNFMTNHFEAFKTENNKEHTLIKEQIGEFKGQFKWIAPILLAILSSIIAVYFK